LVFFKKECSVDVTMRDVAQEAGVSIKTVSRVVNNQGEVSDETRQRVLTTIEELGYRPSKVARALVTQRTDTVGLVLGDITNPFFPEVARGVTDRADACGYNVFLCNSDGEQARISRLLQSLADHAVDGAIVFPGFGGGDELTAFARQQAPLVVLNCYFGYPGVSRIMVDFRAGARVAVEYLIDQGHTAIAMLAGSAPSLNLMPRYRGYRDALRAHGLPIVDEWVLPGAAVSSRGAESARWLLTEHPQVTAIFAYNDLLAVGAIRACRELGRRVPEDCAIVGFDDIPLAGMLAPPLTTVRIDKYALGRQAMNRLIEMLDDPKASFPPIRFDVELVVRKSA
jgi:LacI family transcriptional regulator